MNALSVSIEHDFYSRKPINISFKVSLLDKGGDVLISSEFKQRNFNFGLYLAAAKKKEFEDPVNQCAILLKAIGRKKNITFDSSKGFDGFMNEFFEASSTEYLKEYLIYTEAMESVEMVRGDIERVKSELEKRGELV